MNESPIVSVELAACAQVYTHAVPSCRVYKWYHITLDEILRWGFTGKYTCHCIWYERETQGTVYHMLLHYTLNPRQPFPPFQ